MALKQQLNNVDGIELSSEKDERIIRDNQWVKRINGGDKKAFEEVYKCYYSQLGGFLMRYVSSEKVAEDIIHNVFYKVWENRSRIEACGTLKAYLFKSVKNQALNFLSKEKNSKIIQPSSDQEQADDDNNPERMMELKEFERAYNQTVQQLPEKRRHIFLMHREDKLTYREIAEVLDISIKTVETQISRSIKFLVLHLSHFR